MKIKIKFLSHQSTKNIFIKLFVTLVGFSAGLLAYAQEEIGVAAAVNTTTTDNFYDPSGMFAERRLVEEGYKIIQNRTIETDEKGKAQMILVDGTAFTIGPNSKVILDKFVYNPETNDGFLEMQATGLLRLVGGKVTKKNAATINTNVATVGIRGGIVIIDSDAETTSAAFVYGQEMEVIPLENQDGRTVLTEDGFVVEVNDPYDDIDTPELLTAEALASYSASLEGSEEEEEEESESESEEESEEEEEESEEEESEEEESEEEESEEEESEEEESEEEESEEEESEEEESEESEESEEESTEEESTEEESTEEQSEDSGDSESSEGDSGSESSEEQEEQAPAEESGSDEQTSDDGAQEDSSGADQSEDGPALEKEEGETEQPVSSDRAAGDESSAPIETSDDSPAADSGAPDVGGQEDSGEVDLNNEFSEVSEKEEPEIVIDEDSLLTDSGISDNSSNVAPDQLTTSDDIGGELGASDLFEVEQEEEEPAEETTEEVQDTTAETVQQEAIEEKMSANVSVRADSFIESSPKNTLVATTAVEGESMTYALEDDFGVFKVNSRGKIKTKDFLDFETDEKYDLVLLVTNKKGETIRVPFTINIADVSELTATSSVRATNYHEGTTSVNTIVADINSVSDETPTYEITGEGKEYFLINKNGKIKLDKAFDSTDRKAFNLVVKVTAGTETVDVPVKIDVLENIAPDFTTACQSSCALAESVATGTVVINASRTDTDIDDLTYSLENNFGNKFAINQTTGQVTLNSALDYETTNSYNLKVIATDSKGITKERSSPFTVTDVTYTVTDSGSPSKRIMSVDGDVSNDSSITYHFTETGSGEFDDFVIANLGQGLPAGTTYSSSNNTSSGLAVSSDGRVTAPFPNVFEVNSATGAVSGQKQATISINIPNEPTVQKTITLAPKNVEPDKNLVMKFAGGYNNVQHDFTGANPFTAVAHRDASGTGGVSNRVVTETILSDRLVNPLVTVPEDNGFASYHGSGGTNVKTNTYNNGYNDHNTDVLDFQYSFPIDNQNGGTSDPTWRQYAPMSSANAQWDQERTSDNEIAQYKCLDSGQGCGSGTTALTIDANWTATTEGSGSFSGYTVKDWNLNMNAISSGHNGNHLLNADNNGANSGSGTGTQTLLALGMNDGGESQLLTNFTGGEAEYYTITLPESFKYFGNSFTHLHINENGFVSLDTEGTKPYNNASINNLASGGNRGAYPLSYFDQAKHFEGGGGTYNDKLDDSYIPSQWGRFINNGTFDNSIFALLGGYNTENFNGVTDFSIRTLWNSATKIFTVGWYNLRSGKSTDSNAEVNLEIQFNMNDDSFKIVHGKFGGRFPDAQNMVNSSSHNYFTGISKDISCLTTTEDISACEGKDYIQLMYFDPYGTNDIDQWNPVQTFQNPDGNNVPVQIDSMYNSYFTTPNTARNGTTYCYVGAGGSSSLSSSCSSTYNSTTARLDVNGRMYDFTPLGSGSTKNVLLPSDVKQSFRSGFQAEFMWMHLDKAPVSLRYNTVAGTQAGGVRSFTSGANNRSGVTGSDTVVAGQVINSTTAQDEIIIAGEVYKETALRDFLNNTKKVVAYAPIPILHTNKYELPQYAGESDVRFRRVHTLMPQFISPDYMESKDNGTDANFDFHQLNDNDYCKTNFNCIVYNTDGSNSFNTLDGSSSTKTEAHIDGMYNYSKKALHQNDHVASERFGNLADSADYVPVGQSLWYQVFNPTGKGVGLFAQLNWSCGTGKPCGEFTANKTGAPHNSQQSLFSVLIVDAGDKSHFDNQGYQQKANGPIVDGKHFWSYKRRDGRTTTTDGAYAGAEKSSQITFGINPIACASGPDNGCFFGDNQSVTAAESFPKAPATAIITTSDPCSSLTGSSVNGFGSMGCDQGINTSTKTMELGVMYSMEANTSNANLNQKYKTETFYQGIVKQKQYDGSNYVDSINLSGSNSWRTGNNSAANTWTGRFSGHWMTDVDSSLKSMPQYFRSGLTATFDETNDRVKVVATNINIHADPDWNTGTSVGDNTWYHSGGCSHEAVSWAASSCSATLSVIRLQGNTGATLQFGDDDNQKDSTTFANSAYINKKVFGAILKNESKNIHYTNSAATFESRNVDNAGAMITWDTIDEKDKDWLSTCSGSQSANCADPEPSLEYMTWGIWAMATNDGIEYLAGEQPSAVHMGTWYAGDLLDASDWPTERTATLAGMAMFSMWKSETVGGVTTNYNWTEGSRADGSVVFDGSGNYGVTINVHDLGRFNCDNGASSGNVCSSGAGNSANAFSQGAMGTITWQASGTNGNPNFNGGNSAATVGNGVSTWKFMHGSLYGTASHVEAGAELIYSKQDANNYIQAIGTAILSE